MKSPDLPVTNPFSRWLFLAGMGWLFLWVVTALTADLLATHFPWKTTWEGETVYPAFRHFLKMDMPAEWKQMDWQNRSMPGDWKAPVPFAPGDLDFNGTNDFNRHLLGADDLGRDVLSRIIHGCRTAFLTGIGAVLISLLTGLVLGGIAGYWGDSGLRASRASVFLAFPAGFVAWFYGFQYRQPVLKSALQEGASALAQEGIISILIFLGMLIGMLSLRHVLKRIPWFRREVALWIDIVLSRLIEIKQSIPTLFLIITVAAITEPGAGMTAFWIGITGWTGIARLVRGELLRIREEPYILSARGLGFSGTRVLFLHALPNALAPVWALLSFSVAGAILAEAALSFIREPADIVSWGNLLSAARKDMASWWLGVWPGLALFLTLFSLNLCGEKLRDRFDPRYRA